MSASSHKYRPYFSPAELQEIIRCVKSSSSNLSLLRYLESFALKISHDTISPQLSTKPAPTLEQKLGLDPIPPISSIQQQNPSYLYHQWALDPTKLTPAQIIAVHQYRYENDLMSPTEESMYEASLIFNEPFSP